MFWGYQDDCTFGIDVSLYFSAITRNTLHNRGSVIAHRKIGGIKDQLISIKIQTSKATLTSTKAANQLFSTSTRSLFYDRAHENNFYFTTIIFPFERSEAQSIKNGTTVVAVRWSGVATAVNRACNALM